MWIARDECGDLFLYEFKPTKRKIEGTWYDWDDGDRFGIIQLDKSLFPDLSWDNEPIEVELTKVDRHFIQCDKCGKAFSYLPKDINYFSACLRYEEDFEYVNCPHCKSEVYL